LIHGNVIEEEVPVCFRKKKEGVEGVGGCDDVCICVMTTTTRRRKKKEERRKKKEERRKKRGFARGFLPRRQAGVF
jgi:hypothetical protein